MCRAYIYRKLFLLVETKQKTVGVIYFKIRWFQSYKQNDCIPYLPTSRKAREVPGRAEATPRSNPVLQLVYIFFTLLEVIFKEF
jgi:hypothetical protein